MSEAHRNTRFEKWDLCNQNELVMDLAKTKAQGAQVQEKPTRLQLLVGYKICTKIPHLQIFRRACAATIRY